MNKHKILFIMLLIVTKFRFITEIDGECNFKFKEFPSETRPLYLIEHEKQYRNTNIVKIDDTYVITYNENQILILACSTKKLKTGKLFEEIISLSCIENENTIKEVQAEYSHLVKDSKEAENFLCDSNAVAHLSIRANGWCSGRWGKQFEIGIYVQFRSKGMIRKFVDSALSFVLPHSSVYFWFTVYSTCYLLDSMEIIYAIYAVYYSNENSDRLEFRRFGFNESDESNIHPDFAHLLSYYSKESITKKFEKLLNKNTLEKYNSDENHMVAVPLIPEKDMKYVIWRHSVYFSMNIVPLWNVIKKTKIHIEDQIRKTATMLKKKLTIYTGSYKVMLLRDKFGEERGFYLNNGPNQFGVRVPEQYWKIVYDKSSERGIIILIINDPFVEDEKKELMMLCPKSICEKNNWKGNYQKDTGYAYCCDINEIFDPDFPKLPKFNILGVLKGPVEE